MVSSSSDPGQSYHERGAVIDVGFCRGVDAARKVRRVLEDTVRLIGCDEAAFWVFSPDNQKLVAALNHGKSKKSIEGVEVAIRGSLIGLVAMTGEGICVGPDAKYNRDVEKELDVKTYAMVAAAVVSDEEICGVLSAVNLYGVTETNFTAEHLRTVQWTSYLMGLVLADVRRSE